MGLGWWMALWVRCATEWVVGYLGKRKDGMEWSVCCHVIGGSLEEGPMRLWDEALVEGRGIGGRRECSG